MKKLLPIIIALLLSTSVSSQTDWELLDSFPDLDYYSLHGFGGGVDLFLGGENGTLLRLSNPYDVYTTLGINTTERLKAFHTPSNINYWTCGHGGTVFVSGDGGTVWNNRSPGTNENLNYLGSRSSGIAMVVGDNGVAFHGTNFGNDWTSASVTTGSAPDLNYVMAPSIGGNTYITAGDNGTLLKTIDKGVTWTQANINTSEDLLSGVQGASNRVIIGGSNGTVFYSNDLGETYTEVNTGTSESILGMTSSTGSSFHIIGVCTNGVIIRSDDAGETWQELCSPTTEDLHDVVYLGGAIQTYIAVGKNGTVVRSQKANTPCVPSGIVNQNNDLSSVKIHYAFGQQYINLSLENSSLSPLHIQLIDLSGKVLYNKTIDPNDIDRQNIRIDLPSFSNGIYNVLIETKTTLLTQKILLVN